MTTAGAVTANAGRARATIGAFLCMALGQSGVFVGSFAVFLPAVSPSLGGGITTFTLIFTVATYVSAIGLPVCGRLVDRVDVRVPATVGVLVFAGGLALLSQIRSTGVIFWLGAVCIGAGAALSGPVTYVRVVSTWYSKNRALALGVVLAIAPQLSQAAAAPAVNLLIADHGWRTAYLVLASVVLVVAGTAALFLVKPRQSAPAGDATPGRVEAVDGMTARQVYRSRVFWALVGADCLAVSALIGSQTHLVSWLTSRGTSADQATALTSMLSLAGIAGVVISGVVADRARTQRVIVALYAVPPLGLGCLLLSGGSTLLQSVGVILTGIGISAVTMLLPYLITRYFGLRASAEVFGVSLGLSVISIGTGPLLISVGFDATGSYALPMSLAVTATVISLLLVSTMGAFRYSVESAPPVAAEPAAEPAA
ncbi:MFS transporter [Pseudonocardia sp. CA-107938]|uniref:MFS transporter n=1 Tax=Pseudonocardia sp. CA-107938 TaxID=3240021 RepID=UPI003D8A7D78